ncbi:MAG: FAD-dependent monooxygenase, partial [Hyphomicrobiales bacterium]|nr:FAD-dependent monooxygenase [Hyphomicrobiales bacterium]
GCEPDLSALVRAGDDWRKWALYDPRPLPRWHAGRIGLIGDAAHPILPYLAQGGAMAIEDAWVLAKLLAHHHTKPSTAFHLFQTARYDRLQRIQTASRQNGQIYHLRGAPAAARDLGMKLLPAQLLLRRYDWLYGWRTEDSPIA